jgi:hypothetical protein
MPITSISGVSSDALNIVTLLDGVLSRTVSTFESYSVPIPARRYYTVGQTAVDCEQLTVTLLQAYLGAPGDQASTPQRCNVPRSAVVLITIAREVPVVSINGRPPTATNIQDASKITAIDAWVLLQAIDSFDQWDETGFGLGVIGTVDTPPPQGGFQLTTMQLTLAIP